MNGASQLSADVHPHKDKISMRTARAFPSTFLRLGARMLTMTCSSSRSNLILPQVRENDRIPGGAAGGLSIPGPGEKRPRNTRLCRNRSRSRCRRSSCRTAYPRSRRPCKDRHWNRSGASLSAQRKRSRRRDNSTKPQKLVLFRYLGRAKGAPRLGSALQQRSPAEPAPAVCVVKHALCAQPSLL